MMVPAPLRTRRTHEEEIDDASEEEARGEEAGSQGQASGQEEAGCEEEVARAAENEPRGRRGRDGSAQGGWSSTPRRLDGCPSILRNECENDEQRRHARDPADERAL